MKTWELIKEGENIHWEVHVGYFCLAVFPHKFESDDVEVFSGVIYTNFGKYHIVEKITDFGEYFKDLVSAQEAVKERFNYLISRQNRARETFNTPEGRKDLKDARIDTLKIRVEVECEGEKWEWKNIDESWEPTVMAAIRNGKDPCEAIQLLIDMGDKLRMRECAKDRPENPLERFVFADEKHP